jgi:hypothetical protein
MTQNLIFSLRAWNTKLGRVTPVTRGLRYNVFLYLIIGPPAPTLSSSPVGRQVSAILRTATDPLYVCGE